MMKERVLRLPARPRPGTRDEAATQGIWSGTISFSLVAIPVQMVTALRPGRISFRLLHRKDNSPLLRRMFCPREEKIVPSDEIIRGYEIAPDKYVPITDEELESVAPERTRTIEIIQFIDTQEVDSIYYGHPYYLVPSRGGEKAYRLLVELMRRTNKAGLARFVLGEREYLALVRSTQKVLSLITLHYSEDIIPDTGMVPKEGKLDAAEKARLKRFINAMTSDFDPGKYADERREKIMKLLDKKRKERGMVEAPQLEEEETEGPVDLVAVLEKSMRKVKKKQ